MAFAPPQNRSQVALKKSASRCPDGRREKRLKFGVPERSDRREEREFAEFQWRPKGLSRFIHSLDLFVHFGSSQNGYLSQGESKTSRFSGRTGRIHRAGSELLWAKLYTFPPHAPLPRPSPKRTPCEENARTTLFLRDGGANRFVPSNNPLRRQVSTPWRP